MPGAKSAIPPREASDPGRSAWVAANAGAGKTYTLANRVTRLLLADVPPERILCLTFTKAAAAEMSRRLFNQLGSWAMLPDAELEKKIADIGGELSERGRPAARRKLAVRQSARNAGRPENSDHPRLLPECAFTFSD